MRQATVRLVKRKATQFYRNPFSVFGNGTRVLLHRKWNMCAVTQIMEHACCYTDNGTRVLLHG